MSYFDDISFVFVNVVHGRCGPVSREYPDTYSLGFMENGRVCYGFDGLPQELFVTPFAFWHQPGHSYQYSAADGKPWDLHYFRMKGERARRIVEAGLMPLAPNYCMEVPEPALFHSLCHELVDHVKSHSRQRHPRAVVCLETLVALLTEWATADVRKSLYRPEIDELATRIRAEPLAAYDFSREAAAMGLSYSHFRMLFRRRLGNAPHDYLLRQRMHLAAQMLVDGNRQVKDIAFELNFPDPARFSRLFKLKIGLSPLEYARKRLARGRKI